MPLPEGYEREAVALRAVRDELGLRPLPFPGDEPYPYPYPFPPRYPPWPGPWPLPENGDGAGDPAVELARLRAEVARLQGLVDLQASELIRLRNELREARARIRRVTVTRLLDALLDAVQSGSRRLVTHRIARMESEIKAVLEIEERGERLFVADARGYDESALSTFRVSMLPVPASAAPGGAHAAAWQALHALQRALDRDLPISAHALAARLSAVLARDPSAPLGRDVMVPLAAAAQQLAADVPGLGDPGGELADAAAGLAEDPSEEQVTRLAEAVNAFAGALAAAA